VPAERISGSADHSSSTDSYDDLGPLLEQLATFAEGDPRREAVRDRLVGRCIPLADNIARKFNGRGEPLDDLTQVARIGLLKALDRFDPTHGSPFLSFAVPTIMGEVRRHFRDHTWAMRVPRATKEIHQRIGPAIDVLTQRLGRSPRAKEIAAELDADPAEVTQALIAGHAYQPTSIDATTTADGENNNPLLNRLGAPEARFDQVEEFLTIGPLIAELPERERLILTMRFFESMTQTQIAQKLGMSQMHVSRILSKTLAQLREHAEAE